MWYMLKNLWAMKFTSFLPSCSASRGAFIPACLGPQTGSTVYIETVRRSCEDNRHSLNHGAVKWKPARSLPPKVWPPPDRNCVRPVLSTHWRIQLRQGNHRYPEHSRKPVDSPSKQKHKSVVRKEHPFEVIGFILLWSFWGGCVSRRPPWRLTAGSSSASGSRTNFSSEMTPRCPAPSGTTLAEAAPRIPFS